MFYSNTRWIWLKGQEKKDEYASFLTRYCSNGGKTILKIASEINYIAYVNGKRAAFGQFPGYRDEKYYDEIDITDFSSDVENELRIVVRYEGIDTFNHIKDKAGVIFEVTEGDEVLCHSSAATLGGLDTEYQQHVCRLVTTQLGYSTDMSYSSGIVYDTCREVALSYHFKKRPVKKLVEEPLVYGRKMELAGKELYDFGRETVGYIVLNVACQEECDIVLAYGEHIADGQVRQKIANRDFSMHFKCWKGHNSFEQLFLRIAGRYVEIFKPQNAVVESVAILPVMYPVEEKERFLTGLEAEIYDVSVRTLRLCMHEHYEDCPWREQALYVLDSRNQMLSGYYAFKDASFARANIVFMSKGIREDGMLELVYPAVNTPVIPFFTIMYPVVVWEYIKHTGDQSILTEVMPVVSKIMEIFKCMMGPNHLINNKPGLYWSFYEWSEGSAGQFPNGKPGPDSDGKKCDLIINCAFVYASIRYLELCELFGEKFEIDLMAVKKAIKESFYDEGKGMYFLSNKDRNLYSQLGNAFAGLIGLDGENLEEAIKGNGGVVPATLSMCAFVYDALLDGSKENEQFVLEDIKKNYSYMLDCGATSFWETVKGEADFANAGSLCHGWSAIPIYYYSKLLKR
ncbi:MAG: family 78 glycoside hydrolase catalytic domain [Roseburia sp.]|nr:family 78 glycoside hydrolase catalytic domain [Roseburia sp.]